MAEHAAVASTISAIGKNKVGIQHEIMSFRQTEEVTGPSLKLVHFNISGQKFVVSSQLIKKFPACKLAAPDLLADHWIEDLAMFYFDRDPALFNTVLNIFRYNVLYVPTGYDRNLVMEEVNYWNVPIDHLHLDRINDDEESRLDAEFEWLENRMPPPRPDSSAWMKKRYKWWCFISDPLGPHTEYRKMSIVYAMITIALSVLFLIIYGLSTSVYYRKPIDDIHSSTGNITMDLDAATDAIGCSGLSKIDCYIRSRPMPWLEDFQQILMCIFVGQTILRLALCPGLAYFKSVINWLDILAGKCAIIVFVLITVLDYISMDESQERHLQYVMVFMQSAQVLRVFKIFQYATLIDGLMIMMLTIKACFKELLLLVVYLMIAMFLFATVVSFVELTAETGKGIPDCIYGYWWAIITMTTVGYGDYYPTTVLGYIIGVMCAITGIILTALPVAVIGSNFNVYWEHNKKRRSRLMAELKAQRKKVDKSEKLNVNGTDDYCKLESASLN